MSKDRQVRLRGAAGLDGCWKRAGRILNDDPQKREPCRGWWLQAGRYFADLRVNDGTAVHFLDETRVFAGTVEGKYPEIEFFHEASTHGPVADRAIFSREGGYLVERGEGYVEFWAQITPGIEVWHLDLKTMGLPVEYGSIVASDDHAVALCQVSGQVWGFKLARSSNWVLEVGVGPVRMLPEVLEILEQEVGNTAEFDNG